MWATLGSALDATIRRGGHFRSLRPGVEPVRGPRRACAPRGTIVRPGTSTFGIPDAASTQARRAVRERRNAEVAGRVQVTGHVVVDEIADRKIAQLWSIALGCTAGTAVGGSETATKASLQVIRQAPMTIQGRGFRARESVRMSAAGRQWRVRASPRGSFVLTLRDADRCKIMRVVAVGSGGSRAILRILPLQQCAPAKSLVGSPAGNKSTAS